MQLDSVFDAMVVETAPFSLCELSPRGWMTMPQSQMTSLHYVLSGKGTLHIAGRAPAKIEAGDLVLVPVGLSHTLAASDGAYISLASCRPAALGLKHHKPITDNDSAHGSGLVVLCAHVTLGLRGAGPVIELLRKPLVDARGESNVAGRAIGLIIDELRQPGLGSGVMIRTLLLQCIVDALRRRVAADDEAVSWILALSDRRLWPALSAILEAPGAPHTVEGLAERVGMSRSRFAERFQRSFSSSPMEVVRGLRLQYAARLLLESDAGIARIAERAGYSSRSHFTQQFESFFGKPPGKYRKNAALVE